MDEDLTFKMRLMSKTGFPILDSLSVMAKYYIYTSKCKEKIPDKQGFINMVDSCKKLEEQIAIESNKLAKHEKKWRGITL